MEILTSLHVHVQNYSSIFIVFKQCQGDINQFQIQKIMIPIFDDADVNKPSES